MYDLGSGGSGISFFGQEHLIKFGKLVAKSPDLVGWGLQKGSGKIEFSCLSKIGAIEGPTFANFLFTSLLKFINYRGLLYSAQT